RAALSDRRRHARDHERGDREGGRLLSRQNVVAAPPGCVTVNGVQRPLRPTWQPSLFIGLLLGVFGVLPTATVGMIEDGNFERWELWGIGCSVAQVALITYGLFALAARFAPGTPRVLVRVAAIVYAVMLAWEIVRPIVLALHGELDNDVWVWSWRI